MRVGVIGLGAMGSRVASNLKDDGHELFIFNRTKSKTKSLAKEGAYVCETPAKLVENSDLIFSFLTNDEAAREVWLGATGGINSLRPDKVIIESSTLSIDLSKELAEKMNRNLLIAPVVGSRPQAENRQLIFIIGGKEQLLNKVNSVIDKISAKIISLESPQKACALKLTINSLFSVQTMALAEFHKALKKSNFTTTELSEIIPNLAITSPMMNLMLQLFNNEMHSPLFPINLVKKDLGYALNFLEKSGIESIATVAALKGYEKAHNEGLGEQNISGIINLSNFET